MTLNNDHEKKEDGIMTRFRAYRLRRVDGREVLLAGLVLFIGLAAVWTGQMAGSRMSPEGAAATSRILDELQLPRQLPDAPVERDDGARMSFWTLAAQKRNLVSVYAPWCPACQKELPMLKEALSDQGRLIVLVSQRENAAEIEAQLNNLGLVGLHYYRDVTGTILTEGKVTKLPTTFLLRDYGKVLDRLVGFSEYRLERLIDRAKENGDDDDNA